MRNSARRIRRSRPTHPSSRVRTARSATGKGGTVKKNEFTVRGTVIRYIQINGMDYVCITDIARQKNPEYPTDVVRNWMRSKSTVLFLGLWEQLHNPDFKLVEFDQFKNEAGMNAFVLPPQTWVEKTGAIGIISKSGRYGGTYAHRDIAFEFASWVSTEFKLYLITEFERLKAEEQILVGWSAKRELTKLNYRIHTDAIKQNLIPPELESRRAAIVYADEADVLNVAMFGMTAQDWRAANPDLKGNIRDYATINELICLANLESLNAVMIDEGLPQGG
ncbi:MAG: KilA-N domain-containing protein, partial [Lentisphaeria bacterium]|nr:KilA-N domain-containing protein [Lentisphaeria bacterium]